MNENKNLLREQARKHRASILVRAQDYDAAAAHFLKALKPDSGQVISAYWPKGREFDPMAILEFTQREHCICALPIVQEGTKVLKFAKWTPKSEMVDGAYGIPVPKILDPEKDMIEPDILLLPLLAFDRRGYRLGQGGGFYDATLAHLREKKNVVAVGLAFGEQAVLFNLPVEEHDQKLDWVITPQGAQRYI